MPLYTYWAKSRTLTHPVLKRIWNNRNSHIVLMVVQNGIATLERSLAVSYKLNIFLPHDPALILFDIYPKELKTYIHKTPMHRCI